MLLVVDAGVRVGEELFLTGAGLVRTWEVSCPSVAFVLVSGFVFASFSMSTFSSWLPCPLAACVSMVTFAFGLRSASSSSLSFSSSGSTSFSSSFSDGSWFLFSSWSSSSSDFPLLASGSSLSDPLSELLELLESSSSSSSVSSMTISSLLVSLGFAGCFRWGRAGGDLDFALTRIVGVLVL